MNAIKYVFGLSLLSLASLGCGSGINDQPKVVPVSGVLTQKGKPVEGATVGFSTPKAPRVAAGKTDAEGKFQLTTFKPNDGAVPGEHTITVSKLDPALQQQPDETADAYTSRMVGKNPSKSLLPQKYASPLTTPLKQVVPEAGTDSLKIEID